MIIKHKELGKTTDDGLTGKCMNYNDDYLKFDLDTFMMHYCHSG